MAQVWPRYIGGLVWLRYICGLVLLLRYIYANSGFRLRYGLGISMRIQV